MKTPIQELIEHLDREESLGFLKQKDVARIKWYLETYWFEKEKEFAFDCFKEGSAYLRASEQNFNLFYTQYIQENDPNNLHGSDPESHA